MRYKTFILALVLFAPAALAAVLGDTRTVNEGLVSERYEVYDGSRWRPDYRVFAKVEDISGLENNPPTASFTAADSLLSVVFDAASSSDSDGTIVSYAWNFGDTNTDTGPNPTHTYSANGDYNVELTVTDDDGAVDASSMPITVAGSSGLVLHLEADQGVATSGATVTNWGDQSGNGNDLNIIVGDPQLLPNSLNNNPVVSFDGVDDFASRVGGLVNMPSGSGDRTTYAVIRFDSDDSGAGFGWGADPTPNCAENHGFGPNGSGVQYNWNWCSDYSTGTDVTGAGWFVYKLEYSSGNITQRIDGVLLGGTDAVTLDTQTDRIYMGARYDGVDNVDMDVAAVYVYDRVLTTEEDAALYSALQTKYFAVASATADSDYGPTQIIGGVCPDIPATFTGTVRTVSSEAEFDTAYGLTVAGDAIIFSDGSYTMSGTKFLGTDGTSTDPIYILAESVGGVTFSNAFIFDVNGAFTTIAGFNWDTIGSTQPFIIDAPDVRVACNAMVGSGGSGWFLKTEPSGLSKRLEIDNNDLSGLQRGLILRRCNPVSAGCTTNSTDIHIHHNVFRDVPEGSGTTDREAITLGEGYHAIAGTTTYTDNNFDAIVENNLFDGWNGEEELITIKSDRNVIRNNCQINAPNTYIVNRLGDNNLIHGNWLEGTKGAHRVSGEGNHYVFNYSSHPTSGQAFVFRPHQGNSSGVQYVYKQASDSVWRYNVASNFYGWIQMRDRLGGTYVASPTGVLFDNNDLYSDNYVTAFDYNNIDGTYDEAAFRGANTYGVNNTVIVGALPASACGNAALFDGPGSSITTSSSVQGGVQTINAPSWWGAP